MILVIAVYVLMFVNMLCQIEWSFIKSCLGLVIGSGWLLEIEIGMSILKF